MDKSYDHIKEESFCWRHVEFVNKCPTCLWAIEENNQRMGNIPQGGMGIYGAKPVEEKEMAMNIPQGQSDHERWLQAQVNRLQGTAMRGQLPNIVTTGTTATQWDYANNCPAELVFAANNPVSLPIGLNPVPPPRPTNVRNEKLLLLIKTE